MPRWIGVTWLALALELAYVLELELERLLEVEPVVRLGSKI